MASDPAVAIVVLNWNGLADTLACLESLSRLRYANHRVIVVDNGSTDGSLAALRRTASSSQVEVLDAGRNLGYAGGNNLGIRRALESGADFVLVLNNDTIVDPALLDELLGAADRHPAAGCFAPWILYLSDRELIWFTRSEWSSGKDAFTAPGKGRLASELSTEPTDTEYVCGAALFFRVEVAREIGLFDERFFLVYEDADWGFRARRAGFGCVTVPAARVWHKIGTSFGSEASPLRTYFSVRNKLLWAEKNLSRSEWRHVLAVAVNRLFPVFRLDRQGMPLARALSWALAAYRREALRKLKDAQERAHRRAVLDYMLRRFGDCPPMIRTLTREWTTLQETTAAPRELVS
jgi:GT2 family glycosyltransferase